MPQAALLTAHGRPLEVTQIDLDPPGAGEVLVTLAASGICHTDLSVAEGEFRAHVETPMPMVLGHEGAGVVAQVGPDVSRVKVGDHVVLSAIPQCGRCYFCTRNQRSLCETWRGLKRGFLLDGTTRFSRRGQAVYQNNAVASFAEQVVVPEISVAAIDKRMPLDLAALIGCAVITGMGAARHVANIKRGDVVAVIGCGGVGLNMVDAARLAGASAIVAVDIESWKLDLAHRFGATHSVKIPDDDPTALVLSLTDGRGADVALAAAGPTSSVLSAIRLTRQGGEMVAIAGEFGNPLVLPFAEEVVGRARTIRGCVYGNANIEKDFNDLAQLYLSGRTHLDELVTQRVPLERINDAMDDLARGRAARSLIIYPTGLHSAEVGP